MKEFEQRLMQACLAAVWPHLNDDEGIIRIRRGATIPGRQVFHPFKVDVATLDNALQDPPKNRRELLVVINQDSMGNPEVNPVVFRSWDTVYDF